MLPSFTKALLTTTSLLALTASAAPSPSPADDQLVPRACTTLLPSVVDALDKSDPDTPNNYGAFRLQRQSGVNSVDTVLSFTDIPAGATGCQLRVLFPPHNPGQIAYGDAVQADVWTAAPDPTGTSTWNHPPAKDQLVATVNFPTVGSTETFETILWAGTCAQTLTFFFELSNWQPGSGSVSFLNSATEGFSLVYNC